VRKIIRKMLAKRNRRTSTISPNERPIENSKFKKLEKESPIVVKTIASKIIAMN
jgi:hypothetical protein